MTWGLSNKLSLRATAKENNPNNHPLNDKVQNHSSNPNQRSRENPGSLEPNTTFARHFNHVSEHCVPVINYCILKGLTVQSWHVFKKINACLCNLIIIRICTSETQIILSDKDPKFDTFHYKVNQNNVNMSAPYLWNAFMVTWITFNRCHLQRCNTAD